MEFKDADRISLGRSSRSWNPLTGRLLKVFGPGIMAGLADNDPAGVATYAIAGAVAGYRQLWLLVLATLLVQAVQVTAARLGSFTQQGVLHLTRERYGWKLAAFIALVVLVANQASLIADTAAIGASLQILTGLPWQWFIFPADLALVVSTVFFNFQGLRAVFLIVGTLLLAYVATAILVHPNWGDVLHATVVPELPRGLPEVAVMVALLGTTISPYLVVWQAQGEREAKRNRGQFLQTTIDVSAGYVGSNLFSYFIVVTTAATLYVHHVTIQTAADASIALQPLAGNLASIVFALGLLGAGLLAVPMFAICSSYAVAETFGWTGGLSKSLGEARGFYAVLIAAILSGGLAAFLNVDPIQGLFYSQILSGILMPILVALLILLANDRKVIGTNRNPLYYNVWLILTFVVMAAGAVGLLVGLTNR